MKFEEISLPFFVWYILPGLNFIGINIALPLLIINPTAFSEYASVGSVLGVVVAALVVGFVVDSMKIYQFTFGYKRKKEEFFKSIGEKLEIDPPTARLIFEDIRLLAKNKDTFSDVVELEHARWVMINLTSKAFFLLSAEWAVYVVLVMSLPWDFSLFSSIKIANPIYIIATSTFLFIIFFAGGYRLSIVSKKHLKLSNGRYMLFVTNNKVDIREKILPSNPASPTKTKFNRGIGFMKTKAANPIRHLKGKDTLSIIKLYFEFCHLKQIYRLGWLQRGISPLRCESVADHSFGVAMLAMFLADKHFPHLDTSKILRIALLHDFGEIYAGDITPTDRISRTEKVRREYASVIKVLSPLPGGNRYIKLWLDYVDGRSPEARFVCQVEKLEMALQASVYEHQKLADLADFFASVKKALEHHQLRKLLTALEDLRD